MGLQTKPCDPLLRSFLSAPYVSTKSVRLILGISALLAMLVVWVSAPATAHPDFFSGKTVTIYVSNPPAGGYDLYARLLARHLGRHLPGNPRVVVSNMPSAQGFTWRGSRCKALPRRRSTSGRKNARGSSRSPVRIREGAQRRGKPACRGRGWM
jgi:hypothetical protein